MTLIAPPIPKVTHRITHRRLQKLGHLIARHNKAIVALKDFHRYVSGSVSETRAKERFDRLRREFDQLAEELRAMM